MMINFHRNYLVNVHVHSNQTFVEHSLTRVEEVKYSLIDEVLFDVFLVMVYCVLMMNDELLVQMILQIHLIQLYVVLLIDARRYHYSVEKDFDEMSLNQLVVRLSHLVSGNLIRILVQTNHQQYHWLFLLIVIKVEMNVLLVPLEKKFELILMFFKRINSPELC